jgi:hypothetical protein
MTETEEVRPPLGSKLQAMGKPAPFLGLKTLLRSGDFKSPRTHSSPMHLHLYVEVLPGCSVCSQEFIMAFRLNCWKNKRSNVLARS